MSYLQIYHIEPNIKVLGPGTRFGLWLQGCKFNCPGCLVPDSHNMRDGTKVSVETLVHQIVSTNNIEGITVSGGEPFLQVQGLDILIQKLKKVRPELSVMIFTGYRLNQLQSMKNESIHSILESTDILVDGLYKKDLACDDAWRGSKNQVIHFLSNRYSVQDYIEAQKKGLEVYVREEGTFIAGVPPKGFIQKYNQFQKEVVS